MRLDHLRREPGGSEWLDRLPVLVRECAEQWSLRLGAEYEYAFVSLARRAELPDGTSVVLKIGFPHPESEHEADALAHYDGRGAVRLLAHEPSRNAMLLERCEPGTPLLAEADEQAAFGIAADVLARLWHTPAADHAFRSMAIDATRWLDELPGRWEQLTEPFERELLEELVNALRELPPTQGELVVCHQDLHRGNILRAERESWLAIDPKPVLAERELDTAALIRDGDGDVAWRLDFLSAELGLDRERMRRWAFAHTLAWAFEDSGVIAGHVDVARRLVAAG